MMLPVQSSFPLYCLKQYHHAYNRYYHQDLLLPRLLAPGGVTGPRSKFAGAILLDCVLGWDR